MGFNPRTDKQEFPGVSFDPIVKEYALKKKIIKTGPGEDDFIVDEVSYLVDSYDHNKVIQARTEGCDLKSYIHRIQQGEVISSNLGYGDHTNDPADTAELLQRGKDTEKVLEAAGINKLSKDDPRMKELNDLVHMNKSQLNEYVNNIVKEQLAAKNKESVVPVVKEGDK